MRQHVSPARPIHVRPCLAFAVGNAIPRPPCSGAVLFRAPVTPNRFASTLAVRGVLSTALPAPFAALPCWPFPCGDSLLQCARLVCSRRFGM